ncbi:SPL family radical SAM protein [Paenibacillus psychroresistens]|uniref:SPL family radical SAM protein n=1 Tax=Paenibacillus psychroresistens TaxID=1778678 RepID=UPI001D0490AD|nr:radical SAM protein [Paenibacillus psychroresistens]
MKATLMPFEKSINPYRGCQHGCSFCYARSTHSFLGLEADDSFQNHILLKSNAAEALEQQLKRMTRAGKHKAAIGRIAIGTATDPYQPIEGKMKITRQCLEVLAKYQLPTTITTRSPLILRDLDLLKEIPIVSVNISLTTLDRKVWRNTEPSTPFPMKRLETVQKLNEAGIPAGIFMAPILPYLTDGIEDLTALIQQASIHQTKFVMPSYLRLSTRAVKVWFFQTLQEHYPHLVRRYADLYLHSAHAAPDYRKPIQQQIHALLEQYNVQSKEPIQVKQPAVNLQPEADPPVQLAFLF